MKKYFVTYVYGGGNGWGYASTVVTLNDGKMNEKNIQEITDIIKKQQGVEVVVVNWNKLDE